LNGKEIKQEIQEIKKLILSELGEQEIEKKEIAYTSFVKKVFNECKTGQI